MPFEHQRKPGHQQKHIGRHAGDALVHFAQQITETPARRVGRYDTTTHLIRHQHDRAGRRLERSAERLDRTLLVTLGVEQIGGEESQAIDDHQVAVWAEAGDGLRQPEGFFDGLPMGWAAALVALDFALHFGVIAGLGRGHKDHSGCALAQLLRVAALAAAHASQQECHRMAAN